MADDSTPAADRIAADELATLNGVATVADGSGRLPKAQRVKVGYGADGVLRDVDTGFPLPVGTQDITATGTITATDTVLGTHPGAGAPLSGTPTAGSYVAIPINGHSGFTLDLSGTFGGGTVWMESSVGSTNGVDGRWTTNLVRQSGISTTFVDADITGPGIFRGVAAGYSYLRVRITGATAPSIAVVFRAAAAPSVTAQVAALPTGANTIGNTGRPAHIAATKSNWSVAATSGTVLAANTARRFATFLNDGSANVYLDLTGGTASATSYSVLLRPGDLYEMNTANVVYTGLVTGIGSTATGTVRVTEWT